MGLASIAAKAASKVANKAKEGIKNKMKGKDDGLKEELKQKLKMFLIVKVGIPVVLWCVVVGAIDLILKKVFDDSNTSIKVSIETMKKNIEAGKLKGDKDQIDFAMSLEETYGSMIGFTMSQIETIYNDTIDTFEGKDSTYKETYTSNYGTLTTEHKNDLKAKYDEASEKSDEERLDEDYDIINYYKLSREGKFNNMISPYDKRPIYQHILLTEKYNFNNITWKAFYHDSDTVDDVSKDNMQYDTTYNLLYPKANANLKDMINLTAPYIMSSRIPVAMMAGSMYSAGNSDQSIGHSWVEQQMNAENGKNNDIGNFAYEIIKHGGSQITINQYNLKSVTKSSYWLEYKTFAVQDSFTITKTTSKDADGNEVVDYKFNESSYKSQIDEINDETAKTREFVTEENTRWDENKKEVPAKETEVGEPQYATSVVYKLASALAFDVNVTNSFYYEKYNQEDVDARENGTEMGNTATPHKKVEDENTHITIDEARNASKTQLENWYNQGSGDGNTKTFTTKKYNYQYGKRHDVTRYWSDYVESQPSSQTKTLLSTSNVYTFNKNEKEDPSMDTIAENTIKADNPSVKYYDSFSTESREGTALNTIDILNSNPKIFLNYCDNSSKHAEYVGYNRASYAYAQGLKYLKQYLKQLEKDNNNAYPFAYGATFGFDVNASAASGIFGGTGMALLREYINSWEPVNNYMRTETGAPTSNEDECKLYEVFIDSKGKPTVGYGINIEAHYGKLAEAMAAANVEFPYTSSAEIKGKVEAGEKILMDKAVVDSLQEKLIQRFVDSVKDWTSGIELTEYQLFALTDRAYNGWNSINGKNFKQAYEAYWHQDKDDKYEALYEKYRDTAKESKDAILNEIDFNNPLYVNFMKYTTGNAEDEAANGGWGKRRKSEFVLFQGGYFIGGYDANQMLKFWTQAMSPGNIQLLKPDGSIDETACLNLQLWYEQYWFSNKFHVGTNLHGYKKVATGGADSDPLHALNPEMTAKYEPSGEVGYRYECAWWSCVRANMFLVDNNTGKYLYGCPDGKNVSSSIAQRLGLPHNTNIDNLRPNSLISWTSSSSHGHTGYVEAVSGDYYITSECGGGVEWNGVRIRSKSEDRGKFIGSVCLEDLVH